MVLWITPSVVGHGVMRPSGAPSFPHRATMPRCPGQAPEELGLPMAYRRKRPPRASGTGGGHADTARGGPRRAEGGATVPSRELRLGQELYFVLWDEDADLAAVAKGEVVQYAADWSKVRVKVVDAPQSNLIGRTSWILPDRLDDDARSARVHYQQRARAGLREEMQRIGQRAASGDEDDTSRGAVAEMARDETTRLWAQLVDAWGDVDLLLDSIDFEAGWPENQARLAKFAVLSVLRVEPRVDALLGALEDGEDVRAVRAAQAQGLLASARRVAGADACALMERWSDLPFEEVGEAAETLGALRTALAALGERHGLRPALAHPAAIVG